jgi:hypothetical protein
MESLLSWPIEDTAEYRRTDIVRWWEARRLHFNVYVGVVGVITCFLVMIAGSAAVKPGEDFEEPFAMIFGPVMYVFIANACYTLGWIADTLSSRNRPRVGLYKAGGDLLRSSNRVARCVGCGRVADDPSHRAQTRLMIGETVRRESRWTSAGATPALGR